MSNENKEFSFSYLGTLNEELEQIKEKYTQKKVNEKIKKIHALDRNVDFISTMISIFIGINGTSFLITGTIRLIKALSSVPVCIFTIILGIILIAAVPFIHTRIYNSVKAHYAPKILSLIEDIEQNKL